VSAATQAARAVNASTVPAELVPALAVFAKAQRPCPVCGGPVRHVTRYDGYGHVGRGDALRHMEIGTGLPTLAEVREARTGVAR
jgi:hypothetical protein